MVHIGIDEVCKKRVNNDMKGTLFNGSAMSNKNVEYIF